MNIQAGRLTKPGQCDGCYAVDVPVSWHIGSKRWYCDGCWPRKPDVVPAKPRSSWDDGLDTYEELLARRDGLYGIRVEDSEGMGFRVRCPEHGWLADGLGIGQARKLRDQHFDQHATAEIGLPQ